jgi:4-hydroxy-tetrahydrodipicolinate synthase
MQNTGQNSGRVIGRTNERLHGVLTALATPFSNGQVDEPRFREFINWQLSQGVHGVVPCGTTGESATLSHEEHEAVIRICVEEVKGRAPVVAGSGSNSTAEAIRLTRFAKEAGADAALLITPYYNRPTQEGLYQHFKAVAEATRFPLIAYNVPARTGGNLLPETIARMARDIPELVAIKEATGNTIQASDIMEHGEPGLIVLSGDDFMFLPMLALGAGGVISVTANVAPALVVSLYDAWVRGDLETARKLHYKLSPLHRALFLETNPIPSKMALSLMGKMRGELRLPLCQLSPQHETTLRNVLREIELL